MKKTILFLALMLSISPFVRSQNPDPRRPITPTFSPIALITTSNIQLPLMSNEGITGGWTLTSISEDGVYTYTFTPWPEQNATTTTISFNVFASNTLEAKQDGKNGIYCDGLVNGNLFSLATINGQPYTVTKNNAAISTNFPENTGCPLSINSDGKIVVPYGTPEGQYKIKYKMWLTDCNANYSIATHTVNVTCHLEGATGRKDNKDENKNISVYPNPSNGTFNIDLRSTNEEFKTIKVFNITGSLIYQGNLMAREINPINLSGVPAGYYIAQISNDNYSQTVKLIKQ